MLGPGLLISEGDFWRRQRASPNQPFTARAPTNISGNGEGALESDPLIGAEAKPKHRRGEMMKLTLEVALRTYSAPASAGDSESIGKAMTFLMRPLSRRARTPSCPEKLAHVRKSPCRREGEIHGFRSSTALFRSKERPRLDNDLLSASCPPCTKTAVE